MGTAKGPPRCSARGAGGDPIAKPYRWARNVRVIASADRQRVLRMIPSADVLEIVLPDQTRVALVGDVSIGRAAGNAVRLADPSVSRVHARISSAADGAVLEDGGSSYGTWLDGRRVLAPTTLRTGARIRVGNEELLVDRPRSDDEAGRRSSRPT
jgi:pSer/pThr/pTyr-binding forkhead associated (FHA) protein